MKRNLKLSMLAGAIVAAALLPSPSPVSPQAANAGPLYRSMNGGYYYGGEYAPGYGRYPGYGYSPYGNGGYTYYAPRAYVYPSYRSYGLFDSSYGSFGGPYGGSGYYGQPYRPAYNPYGYGGYGPYTY